MDYWKIVLVVSSRNLQTGSNMPATASVCRTFFLTTLLLAGQPLCAAAQQLPSTLPDLRTSMWHGETISVIDRSGAAVKGRVVKITDDAITLSVHGQPQTVNGSDVGWITRRRGNAGRGALIGLAVGATVGVFTYLNDSACESCGPDAGFAFLLAAMFGGIGGGIGAGVGAAIHSEEMLYAASTVSSPSPRRATAFTRPVTMSVRLKF
jgi:hypothetical protein